MEGKQRKMKPVDINSISPERRRITKIFKTHIEKGIDELGAGYTVTLQGRFDKTPIRIEVEVTAQEGEGIP
jgi:hypothetical protein